jgi:hypothetical protein
MIHHVFSILTFSEISVMGSAKQPKVPHAVISTSAVRLTVIELEPMTFCATSTIRSDIGAPSLVAFIDGTLYRGRYVA